MTRSFLTASTSTLQGSTRPARRARSGAAFGAGAPLAPSPQNPVDEPLEGRLTPVGREGHGPAHGPPEPPSRLLAATSLLPRLLAPPRRQSTAATQAPRRPSPESERLPAAPHRSPSAFSPLSTGIPGPRQAGTSPPPPSPPRGGRHGGASGWEGRQSLEARGVAVGVTSDADRRSAAAKAPAAKAARGRVRSGTVAVWTV